LTSQKCQKQNLLRISRERVAYCGIANHCARCTESNVRWRILQTWKPIAAESARMTRTHLTKIPSPVGLKTNQPHAWAEVGTRHTTGWRALGDLQMLRYSSTKNGHNFCAKVCLLRDGSPPTLLRVHASNLNACLLRKGCCENISHRSST